MKILLTDDIELKCQNWIANTSTASSFVLTNRTVWLQGNCNNAAYLQPAGFSSITEARLR